MIFARLRCWRSCSHHHGPGQRYRFEIGDAPDLRRSSAPGLRPRQKNRRRRLPPIPRAGSRRFVVLLSENMELALVGQARLGDFRMIDRRNFQELAKDGSSASTAQSTTRASPAPGRLLGADVLCIGRYTRVGKKIVVRTTLVGAEKGEILAASSTDIWLDADLRELSEKLVSAPGKKPLRAARPPPPRPQSRALERQSPVRRRRQDDGQRQGQPGLLPDGDPRRRRQQGDRALPNIYAQNNAVGRRGLHHPGPFRGLRVRGQRPGRAWSLSARSPRKSALGGPWPK